MSVIILDVGNSIIKAKIANHEQVGALVKSRLVSLPERREELHADTVDLLPDWWESPKVMRDGRNQVIISQASRKF